MSYEIVLQARTKRAIDRAAGWYHKDNPRAARKFLVAVDQAIHRVAENPALYPIIKKEQRRAVVTGFPYSLLYRVHARVVVFTSCVHFSRDPRHWR
jgi:plasmid stabilization system protein ParE